MMLSRDACLEALRARDARFDGRFYTAVRTTGIYCRPVCPARTPRADNVEFFACATAAEGGGYRACRRCRPELAPAQVVEAAMAAGPKLVYRALALIGDGALDRTSVEALASSLGLGPRVLRRMFQRHLGAAPVAIAQTRRVHFARQLLDETVEPIGRIATAAGFGSVRRFQDVFRRAFGQPPGALRRTRAAGGGTLGDAVHQIRLGYRAPLDWSALLAFLAARATPGVEQIAGGEYRRVVRVGQVAGVIRVRAEGAERGAVKLLLSAPAAMSGALLELRTHARRLFDLDADPTAIAASLARDPLFVPLLERHPGLRVPGSWDGFETAGRAILGQQVTVKGATTLMGRLVRALGERVGERIDGGPGDNGDDSELLYLFPRPERLAALEAGELASVIGIPRARAVALQSLARAVSDAPGPLDRALSYEQAVSRLVALPGIGPWTAEYIALRVLGEPDAFPDSDLVLRRALAGRDSRGWSPWRAYAAMHLWQAAGDNANVGLAVAERATVGNRRGEKRRTK